MISNYLKLRVLALSYTRDLWQDAEGTLPEGALRMSAYGDRCYRYFVLVHNIRGDRPLRVKRLGKQGIAIATNGRTNVASLARVIGVAVRLCRKGAVQVIQAQEPVVFGLVAWLLGKVMSIPYTVCVYGQDPWDSGWKTESIRNLISAPIARFTLARAECIIADGSKTRESVKKSGLPPSRIFLKPVLPADVHAFLPSEVAPKRIHVSAQQWRSATPTLLFVGRVCAQKDLGLLLEVILEVKKSLAAVRLIVAGSGPDLPGFIDCASRMGLGETVEWVGAKSRQEVAQLMHHSDALVMTSRYEGFARVLIEAAVAHLPAISTSVSGASDGIIDGLTGYIVEGRDPRRFAEACLRVLTDHTWRTKARRLAGEHGRALMEESSNGTDVQLNVWRRAIGDVG